MNEGVTVSSGRLDLLFLLHIFNSQHKSQKWEPVENEFISRIRINCSITFRVSDQIGAKLEVLRWKRRHWHALCLRHFLPQIFSLEWVCRPGTLMSAVNLSRTVLFQATEYRMNVIADQQEKSDFCYPSALLHFFDHSIVLSQCQSFLFSMFIEAGSGPVLDCGQEWKSIESCIWQRQMKKTGQEKRRRWRKT